ncbi:MAG: coproporphyrinogen oxidase [Gammaproteobacteria bacterium]|nr:coproporphyrinogen oxidase [Gammaproteobacteria bacterium]
MIRESIMSPALLQRLSKYDRPVPRYTSYPTAPHFSTKINEQLYRNWLNELAPETSLSVYCHIPFCKQLCWYCGCHTSIRQNYEAIKNYLALLVKETDLICEALGTKFSLAQLHFGGGSPSILAPADFMALVEKFKASFNVQSDASIAIELDPRDVNEPKVEAYKKAGINRVSLGVQDFNPEVQEAIHRVQPFELVEKLFHLLRKHEINNINMDLLYGLPAQTFEGIQRNIQQAISLNPSRIALFGYAHVPWKKKHMQMIANHHLPDSSMRLEMFYMASQALEKAGYVAVGLDHFVKPTDPMAIALQQGTLGRSFQGYEANGDLGTLIGLGVSSISTLPQGYTQNCLDMLAYKKSITTHQLPIIKGVEFNRDDPIRRAIIERLMCYLEVDLEAIGKKYFIDQAQFIPCLKNLESLAEDNLIKIDGKKIIINPEARQVVRLVCAAFDQYFDPAEKNKHASVS